GRQTEPRRAARSAPGRRPRRRRGARWTLVYRRVRAGGRRLLRGRGARELAPLPRCGQRRHRTLAFGVVSPARRARRALAVDTASAARARAVRTPARACPRPGGGVGRGGVRFLLGGIGEAERLSAA